MSDVASPVSADPMTAGATTPTPWARACAILEGDGDLLAGDGAAQRGAPREAGAGRLGGRRLVLLRGSEHPQGQEPRPRPPLRHHRRAGTARPGARRQGGEGPRRAHAAACRRRLRQVYGWRVTSATAPSTTPRSSDRRPAPTTCTRQRPRPPSASASTRRSSRRAGASASQPRDRGGVAHAIRTVPAPVRRARRPGDGRPAVRRGGGGRLGRRLRLGPGALGERWPAWPTHRSRWRRSPPPPSASGSAPWSRRWRGAGRSRSPGRPPRSTGSRAAG